MLRSARRTFAFSGFDILGDSMRKTPKQERSRETVRVILEATLQVLDAHQSPTMPAIAKRAGVSVGSVYQYFSTKETLFDQATAYLFSVLRDLSRELAANPSPDETDLRRHFEALVDAHVQHHGALQFLMLRGPDAMRVAVEHEEWAVQTFGEVAVRSGRAATLEEGEQLASFTVRALAGLFARTFVQDPGPVDRDRLVEGLLSITSALIPEK